MNDIILGAQHILDLNGFDHMLFLITLAAAFDLSKVWKMILLSTAFTIGHSLTLFLAGLNLVRASQAWVEFLIPLSILFMAIAATLGVSLANKNSKYSYTTYAVTVFFGLIHGLGFSSFYRAPVNSPFLSDKASEGIVLPLLRFNLGVEVGQIIILLFTLSIFSIARAFGVTVRTQQIFVGVLAFGLSAIMAIEKLQYL
tara:strand:+ start:8 stop:604 length:597 start_codon:yes stop_codon:yes gene_type:complete